MPINLTLVDLKKTFEINLTASFCLSMLDLFRAARLVKTRVDFQIALLVNLAVHLPYLNGDCLGRFFEAFRGLNYASMASLALLTTKNLTKALQDWELLDKKVSFSEIYVLNFGIQRPRTFEF